MPVTGFASDPLHPCDLESVFFEESADFYSLLSLHLDSATFDGPACSQGLTQPFG